MFTISNAEKDKLPDCEPIIVCDECGKKHEVEHGKDQDGKVNKTLGFITCPLSGAFLCSIDGKRVTFGAKKRAEISARRGGKDVVR